MKRKIVMILLILFAITIITGCATQPQTQYASGYPGNQYAPPPTGAQGNSPPPPQPIQYGGGCGI